MDSARYKTNDEEFINVYAENITPKQYEQKYKGNLYCEYSNCNAELIYNERQKGNFIRYFSTKKGSNHKVGCPNQISHNRSKSSTIKVRGNDVNVSDKHISNVLSDAYKNFYEKLHLSNAEKPKKRKPKKNTNIPITNDEEKPTISVVTTPTTNGEGETIIEGKEPYIYKREVSEIKYEDKNSYKEIHSLVEGMRFYENEVYIDLKGLDDSEFSVYIGTPFKNSYEQEFKLLHKVDLYVQKQKEANEPIICTSVGEVMVLNNKPVVQVYSYHHIRLDNLSFYQIINKFS